MPVVNVVSLPVQARAVEASNALDTTGEGYENMTDTNNPARVLRDAAGLSMRDVQDITRIAFSTVYRVEAGQRLPSPIIAHTLAKLYGQKIAALDLDAAAAADILARAGMTAYTGDELRGALQRWQAARLDLDSQH